MQRSVTKPKLRRLEAHFRSILPTSESWDRLLLLTLHDLLELHLQSLDGSGWVVPGGPLNPVDGQAALAHRRHVVVLQEDHPVGVLDQRAAMATGRRETSHQPISPHLWL